MGRSADGDFPPRGRRRVRFLRGIYLERLLLLRNRGFCGIQPRRECAGFIWRREPRVPSDLVKRTVGYRRVGHWWEDWFERTCKYVHIYRDETIANKHFHMSHPISRPAPNFIEVASPLNGLPLFNMSVTNPDMFFVEFANELQTQPPITTGAYLPAETMLKVFLPRLYAMRDTDLDTLLGLLGMPTKEKIWHVTHDEWMKTRNVMNDKALSARTPDAPMYWLNIVRRIECFVGNKVFELSPAIAPIAILRNIMTTTWPSVRDPNRKLLSFALLCNTFQRFGSQYSHSRDIQCHLNEYVTGECSYLPPRQVADGLQRGFELCKNCNMWSILFATSAYDHVPFCPQVFTRGMFRLMSSASIQGDTQSQRPMASNPDQPRATVMKQLGPAIPNLRGVTIAASMPFIVQQPLVSHEEQPVVLPAGTSPPARSYHTLFPSPPGYNERVIKNINRFRGTVMKITNASTLAGTGTAIGTLISRYRNEARYSESIPSGTIFASLIIAMFSGSEENWGVIRMLLFRGSVLENAHTCGTSINQLTPQEYDYINTVFILPLSNWILTTSDPGGRSIAKRMLDFRDMLLDKAAITESTHANYAEWVPLWFAALANSDTTIPLVYRDRYQKIREAITEALRPVKRQPSRWQITLPPKLRGCILACAHVMIPH